MGKLTRLEIKDYLKSITGEMDAKRINDSTLNKDINLAQRNIQMATLEIGGVKQYTKQLYGEGYILQTPTDMLFHPNAIIDIEASAGVRALAECEFLYNSITAEGREPNTDNNGWVFTFINDPIYETPEVYSVNVATKVAVLRYSSESGFVTTTQIAETLSANPILNDLFTFTANVTSNDTFELIEGNSVSYTLAGGTTAGWIPAEESSIESFNRAKINVFQKGTDAHFIYRRLGSSDATQMIEFSPKSVKYCKIYYHYLIPDIASDTDTSELPAELEELLLIECQRRIYIYLKQQNNSAEQNADYQAKLQGINKAYQDALLVSVQDKKRIGSVKE